MHLTCVKKNYIITSFLVLLLLLIGKKDVYAAEVTVTFGSEAYEQKLHEEFPLGVYINCDSPAENYYVEVAYDTSKLRYIGGGTSAQDGVVVLSGNSAENSVKYMLQFEAITDGTAAVFIKSAVVKSSENPEEDYAVTAMGQAPIVIIPEEENTAESEATENVEEAEPTETTQNENTELGDDATSESETAEAEAEGVATNSSEVESVDTKIENLEIIDEIITSKGDKLAIINHALFVPEEVDWQYNLQEGVWEGKTVTYLSDSDNIVKILYLMDVNGRFAPYAFSEDGQNVCPCEEIENAGMTYFLIAAEVCTLPEELTENIIREEGIACYLNKSGNCYFYKQDVDGLLIPWNYSTEVELSDRITPLFYIIVALVFVIFIAIVIISFVARRKQKNAVELLISEAEVSPFEYDEL